MEIGVIKTISGQYKVVDVSDDNAPLISFYNEFNDKRMVEILFEGIIDKLKAKKTIIEETENNTIITRFDLMELEECQEKS